MNAIQDERRGLPSASDFANLRLCFGKHQACVDLPEPPTSEEAGFGIRGHALLEGKDVPDATPEEKDFAERCEAEWEKLLLKHFAFHNPPMQNEKRFYGDGYSGRADRIAINGQESTVLIVDWKSGRAEVEAARDNLQLRTLAVLAWNYYWPSRVICAVIQPLSPMPVTECVYDGQTIELAQAEVNSILGAVNSPNAPRCPGVKQCKWCRAAYWGKCAEHAAWAQSQLPAPVGKVDSSVPATAWTPEQRIVFVENKAALEKWLKNRYDEIKEGMKSDPNFLPGYKLGEPIVVRKIEDTLAWFTRMKAAYPQVLQEQLVACLNVAKAKAEKLLRESSGLKGKALDARWANLFEDIEEAKQQEPRIVKDNEP